MKIYFLISLFAISAGIAQSQNNTGIGTTSPAPSSLLDLTSTDKGLLIPRMTGLQRSVISNPANGLLVYQTDSYGIPVTTPGFYVYENPGSGGTWKRIARKDEIPAAPVVPWTVTGNDQYNNNTGGVGVGTNAAPHASSILDVTSTTKGFLFPRMTFTERLAISNPATGLLVYQTNGFGANSTGIYFYDGSLWKRMARADEIVGGGGSTGWTVVADDQYSNLVGNVGIGTSTPTSKFHLVGNMLTESGSITINNPTAILQLQSAGVNKGFMQLSGNNVRIGTNSGNTGGEFIVRMNGNSNMVIDSTGDVGIGIADPERKLHVEGGSIMIAHPGTIAGFPYAPTVNFKMTTEDEKKGGLRFIRDGAFLAEMMYTVDADGPNYISLSANGTGNKDLLINSVGRTGINMNQVDFNPVGQLHVRSADNTDAIALHSTFGDDNTTIQFYNTTVSGSNPNEKKAFIELQDANNIRMGTNSGNTTGDLIIRMNGTDRVMVDQVGNMGIGTANPLSKLDVIGRIRVDQDNEAIGITGNNPYIGLWFNDNYRSKIQQLTDQLYIHSTDKVHLDGDQVAIGDMLNSANEYKLTVTGKIICEELKVELSGTWPDYVFADEYNLKPLHELKSYIDANHHLPNIPKAAEVEKEGFEVGEMNKRLLEKVEELTLYVIQLQEQIDELKSVNRKQ